MSTSTTEFPSWSGQPRLIGADVMVISLHIADPRSISVKGWNHIDTIESEGGDVEHHVYQRAA